MTIKKKTTLPLLGLVAVSSAAVFTSIAASNIHSRGGDADDTNMLIFSSANPIGSDSKIKTQRGTSLYAYAEGVTWNNGNNKIAISNAGFIQNSTLIHGIKSIRVNLVSGSLNLYHDYIEKSNLDKPQYGVDYTFTQTSTYTFNNNYPMYFRLQATEATIVDSVTISFDCQSETSDENVEDAKNYLENLNIDCGSLGKFATTYYVTGEGNVYGGNSKRALALRFKNTTNNYVSLDAENSKKDKKIDELPDFSNAIFSFKAKFSSDVGDYDMKVCPIGSSWEHPGYILADRSLSSEDGWYTYTVDFKNYQFKDNDQVIRINIEPQGINSTNKNKAVILLDDIYFPTRNRSLKFPQETSEKGLENIARDEGWENVDVSFNRDVTYGDSSEASMEVTPAPSKKAKGSGPTGKWNFILSPEMSDSRLFERRDIHLNKGMLVFDYKPINVSNPTTLYLGVVKHWNEGGTVKATVDGGVPTNNGWYRFSYDLSNLGIGDEENIIRFSIGFDTSDSEGKDAKVYFDNIKISTQTAETIEDGLENMAQDTGWQKCNASIDYGRVASQSSINSLKLTFNGKGVDTHNGVFVCLSPQAQGLTQKCNEGILEAKFRFSDPAAFTTKKIRLILVDANWNAARVALPTTYVGNDWYLFKADLSNLTYDTKDAEFDPSSNMIRLGFGFVDLNSTNKNDKTVWMDDVFIDSNKQSSTLTGVDVWQAYNTEMVLQNESIEDRTVTIDNPLYFEDVRNSIDSTQLMLSPTVQDITYNFTPSYLYSENGDYISPEQFEVLVAKYIEISDYSIEEGKTGWKGEGYYPDALVPIKKIVSANENTVSVDNSQSIWINCSIPKNQTPGTYTGYGILDINGTKVNVPMKVDVHVARLSDESHNKTCFLLWDDQTVIGEEFNSHVLREEYYQSSINRGINPGGLSDWNSDEYSAFAENFANYIINDPRITTYRLPIGKDSSTSIIKSEDVNGYLSALITKNKELWDNGDHVNFFDKVIFYVNDEPKEPDGDSAQSSDENKASKAEWELVKNNLAIINQYKNSLKSQLDNYPELQQSFMDIRNVVPMDVAYDHITGEEYEYGPWYWKKTDTYPNYFNSTYLDTPCPAYHHLTDETVRSKYAETFKHTWFYGCLLPQLPYSGYHIDNSRLANRLVTWMQYDYNFEGQVYWCINYYTAEDGTPRDCWNDPYTAGHCAGDGALTYPGKKYNIYGPITTTRFETIRQSCKDYEYFFLFDKNIDLYKQKTGSSVNSCRDYLADAYALMFNGTAIKQTFTSEQFKTIRHTLLEQLDIVC